MTDRKPVLVHGQMSAKEMAEACGLSLRRVTAWRYRLVSPSGAELKVSTMAGIKSYLRREGYVV